MTDLPAFLGFSVLLAAVVGAGEGLRALAGWRPEASRRFVHAATGLAVAAAPFFFDSPLWLYVLAAAFVGINLVSVLRGWFPGMHAIQRRSIGTVTFPLALLVALATCWTLDPSRIYILQVAFVVLALSDPLASLVGMGLRKPGRIFVGPNEKSYAGSAAFFVSSFIIIAFTLSVVSAGAWSTTEVVLAALVAATLSTGAEALATAGWDNLFIVIAVLAPLSWLHVYPGEVGLLAVSAGVALVFIAASRAVGFLTLDGAIAAGGLAFFVLAFGGWAWAVPAFAFFFLSSLLSKAGRRRKASAEALAEKGSTRDSGQVYANGGIAWLLLLAYVFFPELDLLYWGFAGAFAAAAADTWATEIGTLVRGPTRLIWSGARVPPGTSGGVSVAGTLGALLGSTMVFASLYPFAGAYFDTVGLPLAAILVIGGGFVASLLDSLLGATAQAVYRDATSGLLTERPGLDLSHALVRGWRWLNNDRVNLACTFAGAVLPVLALAFR